MQIDRHLLSFFPLVIILKRVSTFSILTFFTNSILKLTLSISKPMVLFLFLTHQFLGEEDHNNSKFNWKVSKVWSKNVSFKNWILVLSNNLSFSGAHINHVSPITVRPRVLFFVMYILFRCEIIFIILIEKLNTNWFYFHFRFYCYFNH